jgi:hypothetical protein
MSQAIEEFKVRTNCNNCDNPIEFVHQGSAGYGFTIKTNCKKCNAPIEIVHEPRQPSSGDTYNLKEVILVSAFVAGLTSFLINILKRG